MTKKHTPEPWVASGKDIRGIEDNDIWIANLMDSHHTADSRPSKGFPSDTECRANVERIIVCVNACEGMEDPEKEISSLRESQKIVLEA